MLNNLYNDSFFRLCFVVCTGETADALAIIIAKKIHFESIEMPILFFILIHFRTYIQMRTIFRSSEQMKPIFFFQIYTTESPIADDDSCFISSEIPDT